MIIVINKVLINHPNTKDYTGFVDRIHVLKLDKVRGLLTFAVSNQSSRDFIFL